MKLSDLERGAYQVGQVVGAKGATYEARKTEPPRRYTQSDLIDEMMAAHKHAKTDQERAVLREISGLGTSRTREATITGLIDRGLISIVKKGRGKAELVPSDSARVIVQSLPPMLTSVAMTARWEQAFRLVEQGKASAADVERFLRAAVDQIVAEAKKAGTIKLPTAPERPKVANQFAPKSVAGGKPAPSLPVAATAAAGRVGKFTRV